MASAIVVWVGTQRNVPRTAFHLRAASTGAPLSPRVCAARLQGVSHQPLSQPIAAIATPVVAVNLVKRGMGRFVVTPRANQKKPKHEKEKQNKTIQHKNPSKGHGRTSRNSLKRKRQFRAG
jgi:hypothetical protein